MIKLNKENIMRYVYFVVGVFIVAASFNLFVLPTNIVYGVSGFGVILKKISGIDPAITILIGSIILLILSFILLGF